LFPIGQKVDVFQDNSSNTSVEIEFCPLAWHWRAKHQRRSELASREVVFGRHLTVARPIGRKFS
jgi:hypothetical protein